MVVWWFWLDDFGVALLLLGCGLRLVWVCGACGAGVGMVLMVVREPIGR